VYVVLREVIAIERPPAPPAPLVAPVAPVAPAPPPAKVAPPPAPEQVVLPDTGSMLSALGTTESDERPALRRVGAVLVLMTITLATAALVGAGIYRAVAGLE